MDHIPGGWPIYRFIRDSKFWLKSNYQRLTKGYANVEAWNLCYYSAAYILPRLKHLRQNLHGYPSNLAQEGSKYEDDFKKWQEILDKMIFSFEYIVNEDKYEDLCYPPGYDFSTANMLKDMKNPESEKLKPDFDKLIPYEEKYKEGMELFAKHFRDLWD